MCFFADQLGIWVAVSIGILGAGVMIGIVAVIWGWRVLEEEAEPSNYEMVEEPTPFGVMVSVQLNNLEQDRREVAKSKEEGRTNQKKEVN